MKDNLASIEQVLGRYWQPGDDVFCVDYLEEAGQTCGFCGHEPITGGYVLQNRTTRQFLTVERACVHGFKVAAERVGGTVTIVFPHRFEGYAMELNQQNPGTVVVRELDSQPIILAGDRPSDIVDWARAGEDGWFYDAQADRPTEQPGRETAGS